MTSKEAYLIIDIGTGNVRVAATSTSGTVLSVAREDIQYIRDDKYADALYFDANALWKQVTTLAKQVMSALPGVTIRAVTATSQREGIVLLGKNGESLIGLPNIDHRGREWEEIVPDKTIVYKLTGRYPGSLFSAFKLLGIKKRWKEIWQNTVSFVSISDWVEYKLSGVIKYEHSQASETLLYDVQYREWSEDLCDVFALDSSLLPPLINSGTMLGLVLPDMAASLTISKEAVVVVGGGDTQLAIKSTQPAVEDIVIVSGTTTPIVKLVDTYLLDAHQRTWTSRDIETSRLVFEANAGVTGLNFQRLKEIFYPNESYAVIEQELAATNDSFCIASLGSLVADEKTPLIKGGFVFPTPVSHQLTRGHFVWATMLDIACSIAENYKILCEVAGHQPDYVWACGGGLQSVALRSLLAGLLNKKVQVRRGFEQSSVIGGALICNEALKASVAFDDTIEVVHPQQQEYYARMYKEWKKTRMNFRSIQ
ncbi:MULTISPECIES: FGGY-family carbohydrate kinase [Niastella]|uniref:Sugar kinase n=1 Tax=Niastella soli TaxID=2821487 RepID=A0ABS3Z1U8_9BACT|nr:FGGY family carbohydrate kinase [Niastella soli]MBO9204142.1 sugar kinase [Niastella soli]